MPTMIVRETAFTRFLKKQIIKTGADPDNFVMVKEPPHDSLDDDNYSIKCRVCGVFQHGLTNDWSDSDLDKLTKDTVQFSIAHRHAEPVDLSGSFPVVKEVKPGRKFR